MKNRVFNKFGKSALPTLLAGVILVFSSPVAALAAGHGGHGGGGFSSGARGGGGYSAGGRAYAGHDIDRGGYRAGGYYRGGGYYGGGLYFGFGAPYAYGPAYGYIPAPAPCGYYDQAGYWHASPACYNGSLRY